MVTLIRSFHFNGHRCVHRTLKLTCLCGKELELQNHLMSPRSGEAFR
jgi:hypothetical protein